MFHGLTKGVFLGALALLVTSVVSQQVHTHTCISSTTKVQKEITTEQKCLEDCRKNRSCTGFHFAPYWKRCTQTFTDSSGTGTSKICMTTDSLNMVHEHHFSCYTGAITTTTKISEDACDANCFDGAQCKGYIYDSRNSRCLILKPFGKKKRKTFCHVVSSFEAAYEESNNKGCPCFTEAKLDAIAKNIIEDGQAWKLADGSCVRVREDSANAIELYITPISTTFSRLIGYSSEFTDDFSTCFDYDVGSSITKAEGQKCVALIQKQCDRLDEREQPGCPCFTDDVVNAAAYAITKECITGANNGSISLHVDPTADPTAMSPIYSAVVSGATSCGTGDTVFPTSKEKASVCFDLIQDACESSNVELTCPCFTKEDVDATVNILKRTQNFTRRENFCNDINGEINLMYYTNPDFPGTVSGYSIGGNTCVKSDMATSATDKEAEYCKSLLQNACDAVHELLP